MNKYLKLILFTLLMFAAYIFFTTPNKGIGFPSVHPISADCYGYKYEKVDDGGINKVYCYGIMYNYWVE